MRPGPDYVPDPNNEVDVPTDVAAEPAISERDRLRAELAQLQGSDTALRSFAYAMPSAGVAAPSAALATAPVVMPTAGRRGNQFSQMQASDAEIAAATQQLNAGQPVTALPHQSWSFQQAQAFNAKLDAFDQQAKAARVASEQAARDAAMLDQMSRVAKSSKDIAVALQTQDEIGFRNAVAAGVPAVQALTRYPRAASSSMVALAKAASPTEMAPAPSSVTLPNGMTGVRSGVHGEHFTFAPGQEPPMTLPKPEDVGGGVSVLRVSPQHFQVVTKPTPAPKEGSLTDVQKATLSGLDKEATSIRATLPTRVTNPAYIAATNRLAEIKASRDAILSGAPVSTNSPAKPASVAVTGQGTQADPALPQTEEQMKSIPSGYIYRDPKSGKLYRKK